MRRQSTSAGCGNAEPGMVPVVGTGLRAALSAPLLCVPWGPHPSTPCEDLGNASRREWVLLGSPPAPQDEVSLLLGK